MNEGGTSETDNFEKYAKRHPSFNRQATADIAKPRPDANAKV